MTPPQPARGHGATAGIDGGDPLNIEPSAEDGDSAGDEAKRRKREADRQLEADPRFRHARPEKGHPEGIVEVTFGRWIPGSRGKRPSPGRKGQEGQ
jgi:hypothetical protein